MEHHNLQECRYGPSTVCTDALLEGLPVLVDNALVEILRAVAVQHDVRVVNAFLEIRVLAVLDLAVFFLAYMNSQSTTLRGGPRRTRSPRHRRRRYQALRAGRSPRSRNYPLQSHHSGQSGPSCGQLVFWAGSLEPFWVACWQRCWLRVTGEVHDVVPSQLS